MRVLITGAGGQLADHLAALLGSTHEVVALGRSQLDIASAENVRAAADDIRPRAIVNCAAYNAVDAAEDDPQRAIAINGLALESLARAAAAHDAVLVHYSSDFVFDGLAERPYTEDDAPAPVSVYGLSKMIGDWFAGRAPKHYILRVESLFGGPAHTSTIDRIVDAVLQDQPINAFTDRMTSPSYVPDVGGATRALIDGRAPFGLYHCVNSGFATWYELARNVCLLLGREGDVKGVLSTDVQLKARRPRYCALSNAKLARSGVAMPAWQDALSRHVRERLASATTHPGAAAPPVVYNGASTRTTRSDDRSP